MAAEAVMQALHFLGNTNAVRRGGIVLTEHLNRDFCPMLEDEQQFKNAAPFFFEKDFEQSTKDHIESVKSLCRLSQLQSWSSNPPFFQHGHLYNQAAHGGQPLQRR